ncbi:unnamed protein product [Ectocarpus sp. 12 AP-2014]
MLHRPTQTPRSYSSRTQTKLELMKKRMIILYDLQQGPASSSEEGRPRSTAKQDHSSSRTQEKSYQNPSNAHSNELRGQKRNPALWFHRPPSPSSVRRLRHACNK